MERQHVWPEGHWSWPIRVSHKHGVKCGDMIFVGGQVDLDAEGHVRHPGDHVVQLRGAIAYLDRVLDDLGAGLDDVAKLVLFYVNQGGMDEAALLVNLRGMLPGRNLPAVTAVPVPYLAYPEMVVEIEAVAMRGTGGNAISRSSANPAGHAPTAFNHGVRCGRMIYVGAQMALDADGGVQHPGDIVKQSEVTMENIRGVLDAFGATMDDAVKFNIYYTGQGTREDWELAAKVRARYFTEPGPVATGIPVPRLFPDGLMIKMEVIAMLGEDGARLPRDHSWPENHWDWPIHLPYKHGLRCGGMIFVGGQVPLNSRAEVLAAGDIAEQTRISMENIGKVLAGFGVAMDNIVKVNCFYAGQGTYEDLHRNFAVRSSFFSEPGPATTGISLPTLAYPDMNIEIEVIAMQG